MAKQKVCAWSQNSEKMSPIPLLKIFIFLNNLARLLLISTQSLSFALDFDDKIAITDYKGQEEGSLYISVAPCSSDGRALDEEYFVEDPVELLGKPYYYKVIWMKSAELLGKLY